ncbi:mitochondrial protein Pet127-domain-containing protein [Lipomyces japonicus]|uniref:mitochondrial protein Pet127-domain-containing protein n=1 Tax=Lipomyces japonicus TaxID=56871 RepID=UPI0034CF0274
MIPVRIYRYIGISRRYKSTYYRNRLRHILRRPVQVTRTAIKVRSDKTSVVSHRGQLPTTGTKHTVNCKEFEQSQQATDYQAPITDSHDRSAFASAEYNTRNSKITLQDFIAVFNKEGRQASLKRNTSIPVLLKSTLVDSYSQFKRQNFELDSADEWGGALELVTILPDLYSAELTVPDHVPKHLQKHFNVIQNQYKNIAENTSQDDDKSLQLYELFEKSIPFITYNLQKRSKANALSLNELIDQNANRVRPAWELDTSYVAEGDSSLVYTTIDPDTLNLKSIELPPQDRILPPLIAHNLDKVLFNPGVHFMQDPRTRVYNFSPKLRHIMPVHDFDFSSLPEYQISSADNVLAGLAQSHKLKYFGSTSNLTSTLQQFHFLISRWRYPNADTMPTGRNEPTSPFSPSTLSATSIFLRYREDSDTYAIDSDKSLDVDLLLTYLGRSMEKQIVTELDIYENFKIGNSHLLPPEVKHEREAYHYSSIGNFLLRSQQDCMDPRLPGEGTFDIKTRAVAAARFDLEYVTETGFTGYQLRKIRGRYESFDSEYYDMIRSAFLKYSLQARIGRMDGIFVAYHNLMRIFGFQYIPLEEMDLCIHGSNHEFIAHNEFKISMKILEELLERITQSFPKQSVRIILHTPLDEYDMNVFVTALTKEQIDEFQKTSKDYGYKVTSQVVDALQHDETKDTKSDDDNSSGPKPNIVEVLKLKADAEEARLSRIMSSPSYKACHDSYVIRVNNKVNNLFTAKPPRPTGPGQWRCEYSITKSDVSRTNLRAAFESMKQIQSPRNKSRSTEIAYRGLSKLGWKYQVEMDRLDKKLGYPEYKPGQSKELLEEFKSKRNL